MSLTTSIKPRIAVVGSGYWGKNLVRNFADLGVLTLVCDPSPVSEAAVREKYPSIAYVRDYSDVLTDQAIDAIVLATPAATHFSMAKQALAARKDVFVEKPLALNTGEGAELLELAMRAGRMLMVGHILQYHPAVIKLKLLIESGELGRVQYLYSNRLNMGKIRTEENILWSFAPHDISVMLALLDEEPLVVKCTGGAYLSQNVADVTLSDFLFPSGVRAHIFVSWLHPFKEQRLVVVGSEKMAVFDDAAPDKLVVYPHKVEWRNRLPTAVKADAVPIAIENIEPLKAECQAFVESIVSRSPARTDGREGLRVLGVLNDCQVSLETGRTAERRSAIVVESRQYFAHPTAIIDEPSEIGRGTKIWHWSHVMKGAKIGEQCVLGQNCNVAENVIVGNKVKIQNNVSLYTGTVIEDDVFLGPSCVLTNVKNPRSQVNRHSLYEKTLVRRGATVGANATIVCGVELGRYAFIAAGSVVTKDVPDYGLMMGNPARRVGWMSRHGHRLGAPDKHSHMICPESGFRYQEIRPNVVRCLDLDEEAPLPHELSIGTKSHQEFKNPAVESCR